MSAHNVEEEIRVTASNGTGIKIGKATTDKVGFFNATPVAQQTALTAADGGTVDTTWGQDEVDVLDNAVTRIGEIETALQNLGLVAS